MSRNKFLIKKYILLLLIFSTICLSNDFPIFKNQFKDLNSNNIDELEMDGIYMVCLRPLDMLLGDYMSMLSSNTLKGMNKDLNHYSFFKVNDYNSLLKEEDSFIPGKCFIPGHKKNIFEEMSSSSNALKTGLEIDLNCQHFDFENFGFYQDTKIKCNESLSNFPECSTVYFYGKDLKEILVSKLLKLEKIYEVTKFNCQAFIDELIMDYDKYIRKEKFYQEKMCLNPLLYQEDTISKNKISSYINSEFIHYNGFRSDGYSNISKLKFVKNPYYVDKKDNQLSIFLIALGIILLI